MFWQTLSTLSFASLILIWRNRISIVKKLIYVYETRKNLSIPLGITINGYEKGYYNTQVRTDENGDVHNFIVRKFPLELVKTCPVVSAELIVDEMEGIDIQSFIKKIAGPSGYSYEDWTPHEIAFYLDIEYQHTVTVALLLSKDYEMYEFSGQQRLTASKED